MVAPSRPPRTTIANAAATYAPIGPANARDTTPAPTSAAYSTTARHASSAADSSDHGNAFQTTTCVQRPPYPNGTSATAATPTAIAEPLTNDRSCAPSRHAIQTTSATSRTSAVGFARIASTRSAADSDARRRSRATTPPTVSASATRSGFTAGPQIATGASASQPAPSAAATSRPPDRARQAM